MNPRRRRHQRMARKRRNLHIEIDDLVAKLDHLQPHDLVTYVDDHTVALHAESETIAGRIELVDDDCDDPGCGL